MGYDLSAKPIGVRAKGDDVNEMSYDLPAKPIGVRAEGDKFKHVCTTTDRRASVGAAMASTD